MTRRAARITQDEVSRLLKGVSACGLTIGRVIFDGASVSVVIGVNSGDIDVDPAGQEEKPIALIREPKL